MLSENKTGITAAQLKWIAIILMLVNHTCIVLHDFVNIDAYFVSTAHWYLTRVAFVIFAYQISEGVHYTKNRKKYVSMLFLFALLAEIPYDLAFMGVLLEFTDQNVFWNLAFGALTCVLIDKCEKKPIPSILLTLASMVICTVMLTDYDAMGVALIVSFYYFREDKKKQLLISALVFAVLSFTDYMHAFSAYYSVKEMLRVPLFWEKNLREYHGILAWPLLMGYHGEKGKNINKWFFYLFYPGHLLLLYGLVQLLT